MSSNIAQSLVPAMLNSPGFVIFLKYYDPRKGTMQFYSAYRVNNLVSKVVEIVSFLLGRKVFSADTKVLLFEEIKHDMIDVLKVEQTFQEAELTEGDIICFQQELPSNMYIGLMQS